MYVHFFFFFVTAVVIFLPRLLAMKIIAMRQRQQQPDFKRNTNLCFRRAHFWSTCEYLGVLESNPEYL